MKPEYTERVFVEKGKTSRSQQIDDKRLHKKLSSSDRTGKPVKLSEDIRVMHAHDGTGEPVKSSASTHTMKEQFVPAEHRDIASSNADNKFNRATDEENIDFNIPGVPNSTVKRSHGVNVHNLIQKIENHPQRQALQSDLQQHRAFNPFSKESQEVIKAAGNTELCEIIDVEPKAQCRACLAYWDVGIVYCTCGHFLRDDTAENKKYIKSVLDLFSIWNFYIKKGRPHGHRYGKKEGAKEYHTANQLQKKCIKRKYKNIHDRFFRDTWFRKTMLELGSHTHIATEEELNVYRGNWWIRSNFVCSDTMPKRHRPDFKKALSTLHASRKQRMKLTIKIGCKALPHHGGNSKIPRGIPYLRHHHDDGLDTDRTGKPEKFSENCLFTCGMGLTKKWVQNYSDQFFNSQRSSLSPTGV